MRSNPEPVTVPTTWVADGVEHFMAHLVPTRSVDFSLCGLDMGPNASERKAKGQPKCSACVDCRDGKLNGWWF